MLFVITGIFYQRIMDIVTFGISAIMLTVYVITHFVVRQSEPRSDSSNQPKIRLVNKRIF